MAPFFQVSLHFHPNDIRTEQLITTKLEYYFWTFKIILK